MAGRAQGAALRDRSKRVALGERSNGASPSRSQRTSRLLGAALLREGTVSEDELEQAVRLRKEEGTSLDVSLVSLGLVSEEEVAEALSVVYDVPVVTPTEEDVDESILDLVPADFASTNLVLPLRREGRTLEVAMATPTDLEVVDDLKFVTRHDIEPVGAPEYSLRSLIDAYYDEADSALTNLLAELEDEADEVEWVEEEEEEDLTAGEVEAQVEDAPVVKLINGILTDAVRREASDIHIEPYQEDLRVRYRIDGVLHQVMSPPKRLQAALVSRIKILADLDIAERRLPQDGRIKMRMGERVIDFRVSIVPMSAGEKVVLRVLDKSNLRLSLEDFGMEERAEEHFLRSIRNPNGMVLVTGPTGSGKTTTLYAAMSRLNGEDVNIMTAEDPIEYQLHGINQMQVKPSVGLDFAAALRSYLRQDPDIIMVGEIRDLETGGIAIKAALTGHLVLSTLHTNDAANTVTRLLDMGIEPFNLASAVECITAQRLVRKICEECKREASYSETELEAAGVSPELRDEITFYEGEGCRACDDTGYSGRQGLYEVLPVDGEIRRMIMDGATADEIERRAIDDGMLTLRQDGLEKIRRGITTLEEVLRETGV